MSAEAIPAARRSHSADPSHVTILLSTFRGAPFLDAQLRSLLDQTHAEWRLRWRDDGSDDATCDILRRFAAENGAARAAPLHAAHGRLGAGESFLALLRQHLDEGGAGPIAFADQDDIWLPEKIARGVAALATIPRDRPALYFARQMLTDRRMRTLGPSPPLNRPPGFPDALAQNLATGCTVMLNDAAARLLASARAPAGTLHDWWAYLLVGAAGGAILADPVPTVLYRQHAANAIGAPHSAMRRSIGALRRGPVAFMSLLRLHLAGLAGAIDHLTPQAADLVRDMQAALAGGPVTRLRFLAHHRLARQDRAETLLFRLWFLTG